MVKMNKRGWLRIVEATISILLIAGVVLIVISQNEKQKEDIASKVYSFEISILREIQLNSSLREEIILASVPLDNSSFSTETPKTFAKIIEKKPGYLECLVQICVTDNICLPSEYPDGALYVQSAVITSTLQDYSPRLLKIFCWEN